MRLETFPYAPNTIKSPEMEQAIEGIGLVIIHAYTGEIWMVQEKKDKSATARIAGEWTIPLETLKRGEEQKPWEAVGGAFAEAFDDVDVEGNPVDKNFLSRFSHMRGNSLHSGIRTSHKGQNFDLHYAVIIYDGPKDINIQPYNSEEVENGQWRDPADLLIPGTRRFARLIGLAMLRETYSENLARYHKLPEDRLPVFEPQFSVRETYATRELNPDMK